MSGVQYNIIEELQRVLKKEVTNMAQAVNVNVDPFYSDQNMHYLKKLFVMSHKGKLILLNMN